MCRGKVPKHSGNVFLCRGCVLVHRDNVPLCKGNVPELGGSVLLCKDNVPFNKGHVLMGCLCVLVHCLLVFFCCLGVLKFYFRFFFYWLLQDGSLQPNNLKEQTGIVMFLKTKHKFTECVFI